MHSDGTVPPEELPDLGKDEMRIPAGCQIDFYGGFGRRMCVEPYEDVVQRVAAAYAEDPRGTVELKVISGRGPTQSEIVRITIDVQIIGQILEVTHELEERWKQFEQEDRERADSVFVGFPGLPGFGQR